MKKQEKDYHAKAIIYGLPTMNKYLKRRLVKWLKAMISDLEKEPPKDFAERYTLRLMK